MLDVGPKKESRVYPSKHFFPLVVEHNNFFQLRSEKEQN